MSGSFISEIIKKVDERLVKDKELGGNRDGGPESKKGFLSKLGIKKEATKAEVKEAVKMPEVKEAMESPEVEEVVKPEAKEAVKKLDGNGRDYLIYAGK